MARPGDDDFVWSDFDLSDFEDDFDDITFNRGGRSRESSRQQKLGAPRPALRPPAELLNATSAAKLKMLHGVEAPWVHTAWTKKIGDSILGFYGIILRNLLVIFLK